MDLRASLLAEANAVALPDRLAELTLWYRPPADLAAEATLLDLTGGDPQRGLRVYTGAVDDLPSLACAVAFDWANPRNDRPLVVSVPLDELPDGAVDLVLRFTGPRLELWVSGRLCDEEWPVGGVCLPVTPANDAATLWPRALNDPELAALHPLQVGDEPPVGPYWKPRGHDAGTYDCMPYYADGRFHLIYLYDRRSHRSKWSLGAHQWGHASTTDLREWTHHPLAVPITDPAEGSICTGSVFCHGGRHRAFYAVRTVDGSPARLTCAVSSDGVRFDKREPAFSLTAPYAPAPARDPVIFQDPATGRFHMLITTELTDPPVPGHGGCLAQMVSDDLEHWTQVAPLLVPGYADQPECADWFQWGDWTYLIFGNHGVARYRLAPQALGPWHRPRVEAFDGPQLRVLKTAAFGPDRRLGVGWLPAATRRYGGQVVFRELVQQPDGELGTRFVPELTPPVADTVLLSASGVELTPGCGLVRHELGAGPRAAWLSLRCEPLDDQGAFGLQLGELELRLEPPRRKLGWRPVNATSVAEHEGSALYEVDGLDRPFSLDLVLYDDLLDLCVDGRRTLIIRHVAPGSTEPCRLFAHDGAVRFAEVIARPLVIG